MSGPLSLSPFNRRLHRLAHWFGILLDPLGEAFAGSAVFMIDSMPLPVCRRARAWRCCKVQGAISCGYCAAKEEKFFGWRLHLVVTPQGIPVAVEQSRYNVCGIKEIWHQQYRRITLET